MEVSLHGRAALITGGSRGIGKAIAESLAACGACVAITGSDENTLKASCAGLLNNSNGHIAIPVDLREAGGPERAVAKTVEHLGRLDILVCNAGSASTYGAFEELGPDDWRESFELNLMHAVNAVTAALPHLLESPFPRVIFISSLSALEPGSYNPHYTVMKAAVLNLAKVLANSYAPQGILVNSICPGPVMTAGMEDFVNHLAVEGGSSVPAAYSDFEAREVAKIPLARIGMPDDVGPLAAFLASDLAGWITGASFAVDGGKSSHV